MDPLFSYIWPLGLVVISNAVYQICAKEVPPGMNAFASLTVTYAVAATASLILFMLVGKGESGGILSEYSKLNWAPFGLGVVIIGLEVGWILAYKAGWPVSTAFIVEASVLAVILLMIGYFMYHEGLTWNKIVGVGICLIGLILINMK